MRDSGYDVCKVNLMFERMAAAKRHKKQSWGRDIRNKIDGEMGALLTMAREQGSIEGKKSIERLDKVEELSK